MKNIEDLINICIFHFYTSNHWGNTSHELKEAEDIFYGKYNKKLGVFEQELHLMKSIGLFRMVMKLTYPTNESLSKHLTLPYENTLMCVVFKKDEIVVEAAVDYTRTALTGSLITELENIAYRKIIELLFFDQ